MNDHHLYNQAQMYSHQRSSYPYNGSGGSGAGGGGPMMAASTRRMTQSCPVALSTYATLHLDTTSKILNHVVALTVVCDVFLFLSSFSVAYLDHHLGFNTVLCSFLLGACSVVVLLIVNNSRISALSILAPTEFMVGLAVGLTIGASVLAFILSSTYQTAHVCDKATGTIAHHSRWGRRINATDTSSSSSPPPNETAYDAILANTCANHASSMNAIWFWAGLVAWLNIVTSLLLATARHELSMHYQQGRYEPIGAGTSAGSGANNFGSGDMPPPSTFDFEETFRRQQQEILGAQQAAAVRDRAAALFVGDYATIPEVTHSSSSPSTSAAEANNSAARQQPNGAAVRILSV